MSLRVAYNRSTSPVIASDDGRVLPAGSFGVVQSTDDAVKELLGADDPVVRLLTPSELDEPTGEDAPPHRPDLVEAIAELDRRGGEAKAAAAAAKAEQAKADQVDTGSAAGKAKPPAKDSAAGPAATTTSTTPGA